MKRAVIIGCLLLFSALCMAEPFAIRINNQLTWEGSLLASSDNGQIIYWQDTSSGTDQIFAQKFSSSGNPLWQNPILLDDSTHLKELQEVVQGSDGCQIVVWQEKWDDIGYALKAQKLSPQGELVWEYAHYWTVFLDSYISCQAAPNSNGGCYLLYRSQNDAGVIMGLNINGDGYNLWGNARTILTHSDRVDIQAVFPDGNGGLIANLLKRTNSIDWQAHLLHLNVQCEVLGNNPLISQSPFSASDYKLRPATNGAFLLYLLNESGNASLEMQEMDGSGNLQGNPALYSMGGFATISELNLNYFSNGKLLASWESRAGVGDGYRLKYQIFNADLSPAWPGGSLETMEPCNTGSELSTVVSPEGYFWFCWQSRLAGFNSDGQPILPDNVMQLSERPVRAAAMICQDSKCTIYWSESHIYHSIRMQVLNSSGTALLPQGGAMIQQCLEGNAVDARIHSLEDKYICVWKDERLVNGAGQIYYQILAGTEAQLEPWGRALNPGSETPDYILGTQEITGNKLAILYGTWQGDHFTVWLQVINQAGERQYDGWGILVSSELETVTVHNFKLSYYGTDIFVGWDRLRPGVGKELLVQRISGGVAHWGSSGLVLQSYSSSSSLEILGLHDNCLVWSYRATGETFTQILAIRIDQSGFPQPGWVMAGLPLLTQLDGNGCSYILSGIIQSNLVLIYQSPQSQNGTERIQLINPEGQIILAEGGIPLCPSQNNCTILDAIFETECSLIYTTNSGTSVNLQRINHIGELELDQADNEIFSLLHPINDACFVRYSGGDYGCFYVSIDPHYPDWAGKDIICQWVSASGHPMGYYFVCSAQEDQFTLIAANRDQESLLIWQDLRVRRLNSEMDYPSLFASLACSYTVGNVDDEISPELPGMMYNYPNPFSTGTTIDFNVKKAGIGGIEIFNARGQLVRVLKPVGQMQVGRKTLYWDGLDQHGSNLASGLYFCRMKVGESIHIRKMLLYK